MKQSFLSALENKYYYGVSRYFWHIVIILGILGMGAGILVYFWTLVPPSKHKVVKQSPPPKPAYPQLKEVTLKDILKLLPKKTVETPQPEEENTEEPFDTGNYQEEQEVVKIDSAALAAFNRALGQTKTLIPYEKNKDFWEDLYKKEFNSERDKRMYRKTHNPKLFHSVLVRQGFKTQYVKFTDRQKLKSYYDKADLLSAYNQLLGRLDSVNRKSFILKAGLQLPVNSLGSHEIERRLKAIGSLIEKIPADEQLKTFDLLWKFIRNNPNDGIPLIDYLSQDIDKIPYPKRTAFIKNVLREYISFYNNNLYGLKEATNHFYKQIPNIEVDMLPTALKIYYKLYRKNNKERTREISKINRDYNQTLANIENQYQQALAQAKADYMRANHTKKTWREWSYKGIFAGFLSLLIFSLVLLILSMIRNVNRLTEAMYEQNHNIQTQLKTVLDKQENTAKSQPEKPTKTEENPDKKTD